CKRNARDGSPGEGGGMLKIPRRGRLERGLFTPSRMGTGVGLVADRDDVDLGAEGLLDRREEFLVLDGVPVVADLVEPAAVAGKDDRHLREIHSGSLLQVLGQGPGA